MGFGEMIRVPRGRRMLTKGEIIEEAHILLRDAREWLSNVLKRLKKEAERFRTLPPDIKRRMEMCVKRVRNRVKEMVDFIKRVNPADFGDGSAVIMLNAELERLRRWRRRPGRGTLEDLMKYDVHDESSGIAADARELAEIIYKNDEIAEYASCAYGVPYEECLRAVRWRWRKIPLFAAVFAVLLRCTLRTSLRRTASAVLRCGVNGNVKMVRVSRETVRMCCSDMGLVAVILAAIERRAGVGKAVIVDGTGMPCSDIVENIESIEGGKKKEKKEKKEKRVLTICVGLTGVVMGR